MATLYTYCIPYDDGAAPNPFWGVCTLVICKPAIRRSAQVGDWVVGTGSVNSPIGDVSGMVVYAMKVTRKMTMKEYDDYTRHHLSRKIPDWHHHDKQRRVGDSIYDFDFEPPHVRPSVHGVKNRSHDLGGEYALLSDHFYYFGNKPVALPPDLLPIVKQGRGHRAGANASFLNRFLSWLEALGYTPNTLIGDPQLDLFKDESGESCASGCREAQDEHDEEQDEVAECA